MFFNEALLDNNPLYFIILNESTIPQTVINKEIQIFLSKKEFNIEFQEDIYKEIIGEIQGQIIKEGKENKCNIKELINDVYKDN